MKSPDQILFEHALQTLPDSLTARLALLQAIKAKLSLKHPDYKRVVMMLGYLEKHEAQQALLPLRSGALPKPPFHDGDGNGHHSGH